MKQRRCTQGTMGGGYRRAAIPVQSFIVSGSLLAGLLCSSNVFSEEAAIPKEAQQVEAQTATLEGYRTKFTLETKEKEQGPFRVEGTLLFRRPNQRRLELHQSGAESSEEISQLLVSDGTTEWQYYPAENMVYKVSSAPQAPGPHRPFAEVKRETLRFVGHIGTDPDVRIRFEGVPLPAITEGSPVLIQTLRVDVGQVDGLVRELVLLDEKGEAVLTQQYREIELNPQVSADTFAFTPPAGAAVVDGANQKGS